MGIGPGSLKSWRCTAGVVSMTVKANKQSVFTVRSSFGEVHGDGLAE